MTEWLTSHAVAVQVVSAALQAFCTVLLAILTGWYACSVRKQVNQDREFSQLSAAQSEKLVQRQICEAAHRDLAQIRRAVRTIAAEMELNHQEGEWRSDTAAPLLNQAYTANFWAIAQVEICGDTFRHLGAAYQSVARYNRLFVVESEAGRGDGFKIVACQAEWRKAQAAIGLALESLKKDRALQELGQDTPATSQ